MANTARKRALYATRGTGVELMPVHRRKYHSGQVVWYFLFDLPGSTREERGRISESGFATKREAADAERTRYADELKKLQLARAGAGVTAEVPKTLATLLEEFFRQHADQKLAPKTKERYHDQARYLAPELLARPLAEITPLLLNHEWARLLKCGGHTRRDKRPRSLSAKTVSNIAGVISSAFARATRWGLVTVNPVTNSEPPRVKKHRGIALTPAQQATVFESASGPWCMRTFLELAAATGCRRGEILALRWCDIVDGRAIIARSLTQTRDVLEFKGTKSEKPRDVAIPSGTLSLLEAHRKRQDESRRQFGADYRADLDLIFANPDGTPLKPDSVSATVSLLFRRLKLPKGASLHSLRHTHTSHLLADGVPLPVVSERLGHASVRTTQEIYAHMIHGQDDDAARRWEEFQRRNLPDKRTGDVQ
ncbi:MAG: site-specific integrase [Bryobacteraceae bacterium]